MPGYDTAGNEASEYTTGERLDECLSFKDEVDKRQAKRLRLNSLRRTGRSK